MVRGEAMAAETFDDGFASPEFAAWTRERSLRKRAG